MSYRTERLNSEIQKLLSVIISERVKNPNIPSFVSIMSVSATNDLKYAKVFVSILGAEDEAKAAVKALNHSAAYIRHELSTELKDIRTVPELTFYLDNSMRYGAKIDAILGEIKGNEEKTD